ncbi:hypothetical protein [Cohnella abietis]|uniref:Uncharacterized protein n=1 Tax=Cohnella abietis TaxID=2507935 RepID=A0A3T1CZ99_9BACL|nr:hypothetical protein [Cohnella abietis]BBI31187.1 hypothetical protein KCTCHS21_05860 [Cohnella abietis]
MVPVFLSNMRPIGESVAKVASAGGQLNADFMSVFAFFVVILIFVGVFLMVPVHMYEKYYKQVDDETTVHSE